MVASLKPPTQTEVRLIVAAVILVVASPISVRSYRTLALVAFPLLSRALPAPNAIVSYRRIGYRRVSDVYESSSPRIAPSYVAAVAGVRSRETPIVAAILVARCHRLVLARQVAQARVSPIALATSLEHRQDRQPATRARASFARYGCAQAIASFTGCQQLRGALQSWQGYFPPLPCCWLRWSSRLRSWTARLSGCSTSSR